MTKLQETFSGIIILCLNLILYMAEFAILSMCIDDKSTVLYISFGLMIVNALFTERLFDISNTTDK